MINDETKRRDFLKQIAAVGGGVVLLPLVSSCATSESAGGKKTTPPPGGKASQPAKIEVPMAPPTGWDPIAFNKKRGNAGAIPKSYLPSINGEDGVKKHLGKHLPYIPGSIDRSTIPAGYVPIMWGDASKGYVKHPNAPKNDAKGYVGHWYNWIKVRKAVAGEAEELKNSYSDWPGSPDLQKKYYLVEGGGDLTANKGKNTIYLVALPKDVQSGDIVRIWAHCLTHGEYIDFIKV
jgi:hypothetical protein